MRGRDNGSDVSVAASKLAWPTAGKADHAVIAGECAYADALVSTSMTDDGPLLLTDPTALEASVKAELQRLGVKKVYIIGGEEAVKPAVADAIKAMGIEVERVSGATRVATAKRLADLSAAKPNTPLIIARGYPANGGTPSQAFADAMAAAAYSPEHDVPILLSETKRLSPDVGNTVRSVQPNRVTLMGGPAALFSGMEKAVTDAAGKPVQTRRIAGTTRADTAAKLAIDQINAGEAKGIIVIEGQADDAWKVGYTFSSLAEQTDSVYALASGPELAPETKQLLKSAKAKGLPIRCIANQQACESIKTIE